MFKVFNQHMSLWVWVVCHICWFWYNHPNSSIKLPTIPANIFWNITTTNLRTIPTDIWSQPHPKSRVWIEHQPCIIHAIVDWPNIYLTKSITEILWIWTTKSITWWTTQKNPSMNQKCSFNECGFPAKLMSNM